MAYEWKAIAPHFGEVAPEDVSVEMCRRYTAARRKAGKHDGTIWTELGHLRTVLSWAHKRRFISFAPAIERPQKPAGMDRWLTRQEIDALLAAPKAHHVQLAILLMLATAGRVSAILELTWDGVDFDRGTINLRSSETGPEGSRPCADE